MGARPQRTGSRIHDISVLVDNGFPVWPGDPPVHLELGSSIASGDSYNLSRLGSVGLHTGTHVDAPNHFLAEGKTVDQIPLDALIGPARVCSLPAVECVTQANLEQLSLTGCERVLLKTRNSEQPWATQAFKTEYVYLAPDGAQYLANLGVRLVGTDYLSVGQYGDGTADTHCILLSKGVVLLEGLNLSQIEPGDYQLVALPWRVAAGDGAPARAVLIELD